MAKARVNSSMDRLLLVAMTITKACKEEADFDAVTISP